MWWPELLALSLCLKGLFSEDRRKTDLSLMLALSVSWSCKSIFLNWVSVNVTQWHLRGGGGSVWCSCFLPLISRLHLQARETVDTGTVEIISAPGRFKGKWWTLQSNSDRLWSVLAASLLWQRVDAKIYIILWKKVIKDIIYHSKANPFCFCILKHTHQGR